MKLLVEQGTWDLSGIYQILNVKTLKVYIGSTVNFLDRFTNHQCDLNNGCHSKRFQNSFNKHDDNSFEFSVIELVVDQSQLLVREQHYLDTWLFAQEFINTNAKDQRFLKLSYNTNPIAGSSYGFKHDDLGKEKIKQASIKLWAENYDMMMAALKATKKWVLLYSFPDGKFIDEFHGVRDLSVWLSEKYNTSLDRWKYIYSICNINGEKKYISIGHYTFRWKESEDYPRQLDLTPILAAAKERVLVGARKGTAASIETRRKPIVVYDRYTGKFVKEFNMCIDADAEFGFPVGTCSVVASGTRRYAGRYLVKYKTANYPLIITPITSRFKPEVKAKVIQASKDRLSVPVLCYDLSGKFVKEFSSLKEARLVTGANAIHLVLCGTVSQSKGYTFKYKDSHYKRKTYNKSTKQFKSQTL